MTQDRIPATSSEQAEGAPRRRGPSPARRAANTALGALSAGAAGWLTVYLAGPPFAAAWLVVPLALVGAGCGYRYGRRVVHAVGAAFLEAVD